MMYSELLSLELQELADSNIQTENDIESLVQMSENIRLGSSKLINQINSWVYTHHFIEGSYEEELKRFSLTVLFNSIIDSNLLYLSKKEIKLNIICDDEVFLTADSEILKLIIDNLLIQCIIFSNPGDEIRISVYETPENISLSIADAYGSPRSEVIQRFLNETDVTGDEIPEEGILKATGYGMIFCGLAIKQIKAQAKVEKNDLGGLTFSILLKK
ncbi:MAG: hypothetical protein WD267_03360 [Balneolales bacterium]